MFVLHEKLFSQSEQLKLANAYYHAGNFNTAITEYKRYLFFNPEDSCASDINFKIGLAYKFEAKWAEALSVFKTLANTGTDSFKYSARLQTGIVYLASGQYDMAEFELLRIATFCNNKPLQENASFFLGLCYVYKYEWVRAHALFQKSFSVLPQIQNQKVDSLFLQAVQYKYKSPTKAKWMSTFLPGLGQLYAGDVKNSVNALLINSLTLYLMTLSLAANQYWDLVFIDFTIFERYYSGNRKRTEDYVIEKNRKANEAFKEKIIKELQKI